MPTLQSALAHWTQQAGGCGYCHVGELFQRIYDNVPDDILTAERMRVWEDAEGVAGIAIHPRFGQAFDLFVRPSYRGADAELDMLRAAYKTTRRYLDARGAGETPVLSDVFRCDRARAALLVRLGFAPYKLWDYLNERSLAEPIPEPQLPAGFTLRTARMEDAAQLAAVRRSAFAATWSPDAYQRVMRKPGYDPLREIVAVAATGQIAALTILWFDCINRVGHVEPVGTHQDFRRKGLARAVLLRALHEMMRAGMERATVEHEVNNRAALELYRNLGFHKIHDIVGYRRA